MIFDFTLSTPQEICAELGRRLRARRLMQEWSQMELAQRAGLSVGTIKNMEGKGQASLDSFVQVVAALGLVEDLGELFRIKMVSIAAMEQAEKANRQRAPRKPAK